jgi:hypothetical protein
VFGSTQAKKITAQIKTAQQSTLPTSFIFFFLLSLNGFPSKNILKNQLHKKAVQRARKSRRRFYAMPGGYCENIVRAF